MEVEVQRKVWFLSCHAWTLRCPKDPPQQPFREEPRAPGAVESSQTNLNLVAPAACHSHFYRQTSTRLDHDNLQAPMLMPPPSRELTPSTAPVMQSLQWTQLRPERCHAKRMDQSVDVQDVQEMQTHQLPWQSTSHLSERRTMVQRILQHSQSHGKSDVNLNRAVLLAKHIELALYARAGSLTEYCNLTTLRRRLQSLVASSVHEARASETVVHTKKKRRLVSWNLIQGTRFTKRQRCTYTTTMSNIFFSIDEDCTRLVFSFLDGKEVLRQRLLNRCAAAFLPSCVLGLTVEVAQLAQGLAFYSSMFRLTNLQQLAVHKTGTLSLSPAGGPRAGSATIPLYAWGCAELLPSNQSNDGEGAVLALAHALSSGTFPSLKKLQLISVFVNTLSQNGLFLLCNALEGGCCPLLKDLLLAGNNLGDFGAYGVARLLQSPQAPCLTRLDLRRNFIGETGLRAVVCALIQTQPSLQVLCIGGNLVTDNCVSELQRLLTRSACPTLRFLGLEDNFLSTKGVHDILKTAAVNCTSSTRVRRISCDCDAFGRQVPSLFVRISLDMERLERTACEQPGQFLDDALC